MRHLAIAWALTRFYFRLIPQGWYRHSPFLPAPPAKYVNWRMRTAYGKHKPPLAEVAKDLWQFGDWLRTFKG